MTADTNEKSRLPVPVGVPLNGLDEAYRLSQNLAVADSLPRALKGKPADVLSIVLYGQELGLAPMQSIQAIYVVEGRPQLAAQTWIALARRAGHKVRVSDPVAGKSVTVTVTRHDDPEFPHSFTATIEQAIQAGKCKIVDGKVVARSKEGKVLPWEAYTDQLLLARAASNALRFAAPEIALGFYSEGDFDEDVTVPEPIATVPPINAETMDATDEAIVDAEVVEEADPDALREELAKAEAEHVGVPSDTECRICGAVGDHFEDACPLGTAAANQ